MSERASNVSAGLSGDAAARLAADGWRIIVVGAGGWLGLATLELLHACLGASFADRVVCFGSDARDLWLRGGIRTRQYPLSAIVELQPARSLVLHNAFLTQEKARTMSREDYVSSNTRISDVVFANLDHIGTQGLFLPSSGAVYRVDQPDASQSLRLYGQLKLADEARADAWARETGGAAAICRVFNLSGPYINKQSSYALASFINDALAGRPIEVRANRPVYRSYVAIRDLMSIVLAFMTAGEGGCARFDTAGQQMYEMGELADLVSRVVGQGGEAERGPLCGAPAEYYIGDNTEQDRLARRFGVKSTDMDAQIEETARFMAEASVDGLAPRAQARQ